MNKMEEQQRNRKGFFWLVPTVGMLIVVAVIIGILFLGTYGIIYFVSKYALAIVGLIVILASAFTGFKSGNFKTGNYVFLAVGVLLLILSVPAINHGLFGQSMTSYTYTQEFGVVKFTTVTGGLFGASAQNVYNIEGPTTVRPGQSMSINMGVFKKIGSKMLTKYEICWAIASGGVSNCIDKTSQITSSGESFVEKKLTFSAPSSEGNYIVYDRWIYDNNGQYIDSKSEAVPFTVENVITNCGNIGCNPAQVLRWYETSQGRGYCDVKTCWDFSAPPQCVKQNFNKYQMHCPAGTLIEGKSSNIEEWQTNGCSNCIEDNIPPTPETECTQDVMFTCADGTSIIYQKCLNNELVQTENECPAASFDNSTNGNSGTGSNGYNDTGNNGGYDEYNNNQVKQAASLKIIVIIVGIIITAGLIALMIYLNNKKKRRK